MFAGAKALLVIASCALVAQAQSSGNPSTTATAPASSSSTPALPDNCIIECQNPIAVQYGCGTYSNLTCVCTSTAYQQAALNCIQANCTAADVQTATQSQQEVCGALFPSSAPASTAASTAASTLPSSGTPSTSASATQSATQSATSSSAAMALSAPFSLGSLVVILIASAGTLVGTAFVL